MSTVQIESVDEPFRSHPELAELALRLLTTSHYLGAVPEGRWQSLNPLLILAIGDSLSEGKPWRTLIEIKTLGEQLQSHEAARDQLQRYRDVLLRLQTELEESPRPRGEWGPVVDTLGEDVVAGLLGISVSSLRRYGSGERRTPQDAAERLHFLALLLGELAGSYNEYGMRRWFGRPRAALDGRAPADLMGKDFDPDSADGERIRRLAESLRAA